MELPRVKFLLVDDLEENLLALSALLQRDDVELLVARSGFEALELLLVHEVALAFIDVQMPVMDGFELAELIRGSERTRNIPLIFVTAGMRDERRMFKGYETGAVDFLYKPIEPHILRNKAEVFFQLYRQKQQLALELRERTETLRLNEMFVAILGHDLRNPLGAVLMAATLLQRTYREEVAQKASQQIINSSKRMAKLIENMLDLARARLAGGIGLTRESARLGEVVERVVQEYQATYPDCVIERKIQGEDAGHWDADRLGQVAANLLGNALQHGTPGRPVRIGIDGRDEQWLALTVANEGVIPAQVLPNIFDPFRGGERVYGRNEGLGLGLYIAQQVVAAHGGEIGVRSDGEAQTVFTVRIPRR
ncbi:HAMP domain-containing sensor histidine kinase [Herbaspirillum sp. WKF16]|uniref:hybrid sensor histidine kinase/response regulator n=1 Tax=Herbaspirillum sp. WKF16 TaxID=3028312 RepID=UPI0023A9739E|nr:HAMP domain-containing sensor histidine kinase [Herbaspirillum sp. WKF16]WDZ98463.1 HAMP domain-containing sensor histidine kinase [Herbaspirillum sp. WKF16]